MKKIFVITILLFLFVASKDKANAATLGSISDTISTSRPSASAPLDADQAAAATSVSIIDNGSMFLSSDSAKLLPDTGETLSTTTIASMSAASSGVRTVYFNTAAANTHHAGDALIAPVTAMHTVQFTTTSPIPASGKVVITFPGAANNTASPSATAFAFNGLTSTNIKANNITCDTWNVSSPTITCTTNAGVGAGTVVTFLIGCSANTGTACTAQVPTIINPTISANCIDNATCEADVWTISVTTKDGSDVDVDDGYARVGTINSVMVQATVDPSLSFSIAGIAHNTAANTGNTTGCTNSELTNSGIGSSATSVDLGALGTTINISAQLLTVTTNAAGGYSLTATSSGHLINPATGFWIIDSTTPAVFPAGGTPWFGIHACGLDVNSTTWGTGATAKGSGGKYGWPSRTTALTLATDSTGPVGDAIETGNGLTTVEYGALVDVSVPAGTYTSTVTYVATPTF